MGERTLGGAQRRDKRGVPRGGPGRVYPPRPVRPTVRQGLGETGGTLGDDRTATPLGAVIALSASMSIGAALLAGPILWDRLPVTDLPLGFASHHQDAETLIFLLAFAVLVPSAVFASIRASDRIAAGHNAGGLSLLVAVLTGGLALVVIAARLSGLEVLAAGAAVWGAVGDGWAGARRVVPPVAAAGAGRAPRAVVLGCNRAAGDPVAAVLLRPRFGVVVGGGRERGRGGGPHRVGLAVPSATHPSLARPVPRRRGGGAALAGGAERRDLRVRGSAGPARPQHHPVSPELLPRSHQPGAGRRCPPRRRALAVRSGLDLLLVRRVRRGADRQRHARPGGGRAVSADVHRHLRQPCAWRGSPGSSRREPWPSRSPCWCTASSTPSGASCSTAPSATACRWA